MEVFLREVRRACRRRSLQNSRARGLSADESQKGVSNMSSIEECACRCFFIANNIRIA